MTHDEMIRVAVFAFGTIVIGGSLGEMVYGPRRGMTWAQFLRYASLAIVLGTVLVAQYERRHLPVTGYTIAFGIGAFVGSLGVAPALQKPMIKSTAKEPTDAARTRPQPL